MRVPLSWLHEFVDPSLDVERLAEVLTLGGLVVERILRPTAGTRGVVVGRVEAVEKLAGSDKLSVVDLYDGRDHYEIVCGASNFSAGDHVPAALPGAVLPGGFEIGRRKLMGVTSNGMLASARELGVGDDHSGIWVLGDDAPLGEDLTGWLDLDDEVLELDLNPDRGYAQSILGVARDVAALTGADLHLPEPAALPSGATGVGVDIEDPTACPRFSVTMIERVTVGPSPAPLQRRLAAAGMRSISGVVDATNAAMLETGHPAHAYDAALVAGGRIEVRQARSGETVVTLDDVERPLDPVDLVIADADGPVGLAGVMGGVRTEVGPATRDVLLEVAAFAPAAVLRTGRRHKLFTEASTRFEKGVSPGTVAFGAARCAALLAELSGGGVVGFTDAYPQPVPRPVIELRTGRARRLLGLDVDDARQAELLQSIGFTVAAAEEGLRVTVPDYRTDVRIEEDLWEEIARLHGYDQVPERVPSSGRVGGRLPPHEARRTLRRALAGAGWAEVVTMPFIGRDDIDALGLPADDPRREPVALTNPLSSEESVLRTTMLPGLLRVLRNNVRRQNADPALFEVGSVFLPPGPGRPGADGGPDGVTLPAEPAALAFAVAGNLRRERYDEPGRAADFFDVVGAAELAARSVGRGPLQVEPTDEAPYHPGRAARLLLDGTDLGIVGELHPRVVAALELPARAVAGELLLDVLTAAGIGVPRPPTPSALPPLRFDVAVVTEDTVPAGAVEAAVRAGSGPRLTECRLFDVYAGAQVGDGRRSLAYRLRFDDPDEPFSEGAEADLIASIERAVAERVGGSLRR